MRLMLSVVVLGLALGLSTARAQVDASPDAAAIHGAIQGQIEALKRDDAAGAYAFAAPNVQTVFPTPQAFIGMVQRGYQPVYRPQSYHFGTLTQASGSWVQTVELVGPDGEFYTAAYTMARMGDGSWKITGCVIVKTPGGSA